MINDTYPKSHLQDNMNLGMKALMDSPFSSSMLRQVSFSRRNSCEVCPSLKAYPPPLIRYYQMFCDKGGFCELGISLVI